MKNQPPSPTVTLTLRDQQGNAWNLRLSRDCLRFIGRYQRVKGFEMEAMTLFDGVRRSG